jgi:hypothetical protein
MTHMSMTLKHLLVTIQKIAQKMMMDEHDIDWYYGKSQSLSKYKYERILALEELR